MTSTSLSLSGVVHPVGAGLASPFSFAVLIPTVNLTPLNATLTKNEGGLSRASLRPHESFLAAQLAAPPAIRFPILPRETNPSYSGREPTPGEPNPFKRNAYKKQGGAL